MTDVEERKTEGFYPTRGKSGAADLHAAAAARAGTELGEPTSFRGGAGAPEPIQIIRKTTPTYTHGFASMGEEYATPLQAQQAHNRAMLQRSLGDIAARSDREKLTRPGLVEAAQSRYGEYRAPGQTLEEIKNAGLAEARQAQGEFYRSQARGQDVATKGVEQQQQTKTTKTASPEATNFLEEILKQQGRAVPKQNAPGYDYEWPTDRGVVDDINRAFDIAKNQGAEAARKDFEESRHFREFEPLFSPEMRARGQKNPEFWRRFVLEKGPELRKRLGAERERMREESFYIQ